MIENNVPVAQKTPGQPLTPRLITLARLVNDSVILLITAFLVIPGFLDAPEIRAILIIVQTVTFAIFLSTLVGFILVRRERVVTGMGFVVYGLIFGLFTISFFVQGLGAFALVAMVLVTALSVSTSLTYRRMIEAIAVSTVVGVSALLIDTNLGTASFRIQSPEILPTVLWVITLALSAVFLYFISRQFSFLPLRTKLGASFVLVTVVALAILGFFNSRRVRATLIEEANQALFAAASQTEDALLDFINNNLQSVSTEANLPILIDYLQTPLSQRRDTPLEDQVYDTLLALAGKDKTYITSYALLDRNGTNVVDTNLIDVGSDKSDRLYFTETIASGAPYQSPLVISPTTGLPSLYFSAPVRTPSNQFIGVLRVRFDGNILQTLLERSQGLVGQDSFGVLFDENFLHLAHGTAPETIFSPVKLLGPSVLTQLTLEGRVPDQPFDETHLEDLAVLAHNLELAQNSDDGVVFFSALDVATGDRINQVVVIDMEDSPWLLAFFQPQDIFLQPVKKLTNFTIGWSLASAGGALLLAIALTQMLTAPLINLTDSARLVTEGDLSTRVEVISEDEIGELSTAFNTMTSQLQTLVTSLESQVDERTSALQTRAAQHQAAAEIARDATSEPELDALLERAVHLISDRFNFYYVGIFFVDNRKESILLMEASPPLGEQLKQAELRYEVNPETNIGYVCLNGEPRIASTEDPTSAVTYHPLLTSTQSQMVLPLRVGEAIIGAVDIHSMNPSDFNQEDIVIFQTMADQLAIAIQKTEFREEIQEALNELETAYGLYTRESWRRFIQSEDIPSGYRYQQLEVEPVTTSPQQVSEVWQKGDVVLHQRSAHPEDGNNTSTIAVPMKIRGEVIGVLNLALDADQVPGDTANLVQEIAGRLGLVLENARLIENAQRREERERLIGEITDSFRQSLDIDAVLRSAVQEIGQSFDLAEVEIRLGQTSTPEDGDQSNGHSNEPPYQPTEEEG